MNKKIIAFAISALMVATMSTTAFATKGYPNELQKVEDTAITNAVEEAVKNIDVTTGAKSATVELQNVTEMTADNFKKVAELAEKKNVTAVVQVDRVINNKVIARFFVDPVKAATLEAPISFSVETDNKATRNTFENYFQNNIAIASFGQLNLGIDVDVALKLDLNKLNTNNALLFYSYNAEKNSYMPLTSVKYAIDANGYIHFNLNRAGDIIITDAPLTLK